MSKEKISRAERQRMKNYKEMWSGTKKEDKIEMPYPDNSIDEDPLKDFFNLECKEIMFNKKLSDKDKERQISLVVEREKKKKEIISQLKKTPIVQLACERTGNGRSTYYKWRSTDTVFARTADRAIEAGRFLINDLAESKLIRLIQDENLTAIIFWLKHNHPKYATVNRVIHEYEVVTDTPSVEEKNVSALMVANVFGDRLTSKEMIEESKKQITENIEETLFDVDSDKRRSFLEDDGK